MSLSSPVIENEWVEVKNKKSEVWNYYLKSMKNPLVKCKKCNKILRCVDSSTSSIRRHLTNVHSMKIVDKPETK